MIRCTADRCSIEVSRRHLVRFRPPRAGHRLVAFALLAWLLLLPGTRVTARPLYAARTGMACARCHVDPAGGGMRTGTGFKYALNLHTMAPAEDREAPFDPKISDGVRLGGDMRGMYLQDAHNELSDQSTFFLMQAALYLAVSINDRTTFAIANDQGRTTEAYALIGSLPLDGSLKIGRFVPAYGIEEEDHTLFTRDSLGFGTAAEDVGIEFTHARGARLVTLALVNGSHGVLDDNPQKALVGRAMWFNDRFGFGASGFINTPYAAERTSRFGAFGQFHQGPLVILAEYDRAEDTPEKGPLVKAAALMVDGSCAVGERTTLRATFDRFDPNTDYAENARDRIGIGLDADLMSFTRLMLRARGVRQYGHDEYGVRRYGTDRDFYELFAQLAFGF
jgi:hypothetical protein